MNPSVGVVRQMEWEQQAAQASGLPWRVSLWTPKSLNSPVVVAPSTASTNGLLQYAILRAEFSRWLVRESVNVDVVLLRHSVHDLFEWGVIRKIGAKSLTVHHTLEEQELAGGVGVGAKLGFRLERLFGRSSLRQLCGVVGVTKEIVDYEILRRGAARSALPTFVYPNGIFSSVLLPSDQRGALPELLFIASSFVPWHGLDLLLSSMEKDLSPCRVHLVGYVPEMLRRRCMDDSRIVLHGMLDDSGIAALATSAWCGLSSFALGRKGMFEACTLKVREYLDAGLPVYANHRDAGLPDEFAFFCKGDANLQQILAFATKCRYVSKSAIREAAQPFIDKRDLLVRFYEQLSEAFAKGGCAV